jgi:hypothetical protein
MAEDIEKHRLLNRKDFEDELNTSIEVRLPRSEQGNIELVFDGVSGDSIVVQVYVCMSPA